MKTATLLALPVAFLLATGTPGGDKEAKKGLDKLEGTWTIVSVENKGKKEKEAMGDIAVFSGNKVTFTIGGDKDTADFKLDPAKAPKWFDITSGAYKSVGIYKLEGDTLTVSLNQSGKERPTAFQSEADSPNERLFVLRRVK